MNTMNENAAELFKRTRSTSYGEKLKGQMTHNDENVHHDGV